MLSHLISSHKLYGCFSSGSSLKFAAFLTIHNMHRNELHIHIARWQQLYIMHDGMAQGSKRGRGKVREQDGLYKWDNIKRKLGINNLKMSHSLFLDSAFDAASAEAKFYVVQFPFSLFVAINIYYIIYVCAVIVLQIAIMRVWCCHNWHCMLS